MKSTTETRACAVAICDFVTAVFEPLDIVEVRILPPSKRNWCKAGELTGFVPELEAFNREHANIYVGGNPRKQHGGGKTADVALARCLFADWDGGMDLAAARTSWTGAGLPEPTIIIHSGHGIHAYWRFASPILGLPKWSRLQKALIAAVGSDPRIHDPPRIMRLPGFLNHKYEPSVPCEIVESHPNRRFDTADLEAVLSDGHYLTEQAEACRADSGMLTQADVIVSESSFSDSTAASPLDEATWRAIRQTLPRKYGERNGCLWQLARKLKGIDHLVGAGVDELEPILLQWHARALPNIRTTDYHANLTEFLTAWGKVQFAEGADTMAAILDRAQKGKVPACATRFAGSPQLQLLVSICREWQNSHRDDPFYLSCRTAAKFVGVSPETANHWLRLLVQLQILRVVEAGSNKTNKATRYEYLGD